MNDTTQRRIVVARVTLGTEGFVAATEGAGCLGVGFSSSAAVRSLARQLDFPPGFDVAYQGQAAEGHGHIWHIVEVQ